MERIRPQVALQEQQRKQVPDKVDGIIFDYKKVAQLPRKVARYVTFGKQADSDIFPGEQRRFARDKQVELLGEMNKTEWESLVTFATWQSEVVTTRLRRSENRKKVA